MRGQTTEGIARLQVLPFPRSGSGGTFRVLQPTASLRCAKRGNSNMKILGSSHPSEERPRYPCRPAAQAWIVLPHQPSRHNRGGSEKPPRDLPGEQELALADSRVALTCVRAARQCLSFPLGSFARPAFHSALSQTTRTGPKQISTPRGIVKKPQIPSMFKAMRNTNPASHSEPVKSSGSAAKREVPDWSRGKSEPRKQPQLDIRKSGRLLRLAAHAWNARAGEEMAFRFLRRFEKLHLRAQLRREEMVGLQNLHLDLQRAFGAVRFRRDLRHAPAVGFVRIRLGADAALLVQRNLRQVRLVHVDFHLQVLLRQ